MLRLSLALAADSFLPRSIKYSPHHEQRNRLAGIGSLLVMILLILSRTDWNDNGIRTITSQDSNTLIFFSSI